MLVARMDDIFWLHVRLAIGYSLIVASCVVGLQSIVTSSTLVRERMLLHNLATSQVRQKREMKEKHDHMKEKHDELHAELTSTRNEKIEMKSNSV